MTDKILSIIIPLYNVQDYIAQCLDSIFCGLSEQDKHSIEIIAINDGSTDNSLAILEQYKKTHGLTIINQPNSGQSSARNKGLSIAIGKYVWFVDSDDYLSQNAVKDALNFIKSHLDCDLFMFPYYTLDCNTQKIEEKKAPFHPGSGEDVFAELINKTLEVVPWNKIILTSLLKENNLLFCSGLIHEDCEWTPRLLAFAHKMLYLPKPLYVYKINRKASIMSNNQPLNSALTSLKIADKLYSFVQENDLSIKLQKLILRQASSFFWVAVDSLKRTAYNECLLEELQRHYYLARFSKPKRKYVYFPLIQLFGLKFFSKLH